MKGLIFATAVCVLLAGPVRGDLITNGSFEDSLTYPGPIADYVTVTSTEIDNWTVTNPIDYIGGRWIAPAGVRSLDLNALDAGGIQQTIATTPGVSYKVTFSLAGNPGAGPTIKELDVSAIGAGPPAVASFSFDITGKTHAAMGWTTEGFTFVADAASTILRFTSTTTGPSSAGPALDNVAVEAVPIPAAVLLGMLGLGVAGLRLRKPI